MANTCIYSAVAIAAATVVFSATGSGAATWRAPADGGPTLWQVQAKPQGDKPGDPPGVTIGPTPAPDAPGTSDQAPLTPGIRPPQKDAAPGKPPERKAEPKPDDHPPAQRDARPAPKSTPKADPSNPKAAQGPAGSATKGGKQAGNDKPGLAVAQPRTAAERDKALSDLYAYLATAEDAKQAAAVSNSIERLWVTPGSDTINLLMQRALQAHAQKNPALALKLLDAVVALAPDYAEGWNRRAYIHYTQDQIDLALGDLRRTLALDPNHFKALDGLIHILKDIGRKKEALQAARQLLDVNPFYEGAKQIVDELSREIEGRGI